MYFMKPFTNIMQDIVAHFPMPKDNGGIKFNITEVVGPKEWSGTKLKQLPIMQISRLVTLRCRARVWSMANITMMEITS